MLKKLILGIFQKKQYYVWICSYAIIIILSILINMIGYSVAIDSVEHEIAKTNSATAAQIKSIYDDYFKGIENTAYNMLHSYNVSLFITKRTPADIGERTEWIRSILRDLSVQASTKELISNAMIIFRDSDICIDTTGMYPKENAYELFFSDSYATKDAWLSDIFNSNIKEYKLINNTKGNSKTYFFHSYVTGTDIGNAVILIELKSQTINQYLTSVVQNNGNAYIINTDSTIMFSSDKNDNITFNFEESSGSYIQKIGGTKNVITYVTSTRNGWKYVYTVPNDVYTSQVTKVRFSFMLSYLLCLLVGFSLAFAFAKINYKPLSSLMKKLSGGTESYAGSEFSYIDAALNDLFKDKRKIEQKAYEQSKQLKENVLSKLLTNKIIIKKDNIKFLIDHDLHLTGKKFTVMIFDIVEIGSIGKDSEAIDYEDYKISRYAVSNVFSELINEVASTYYCEISDSYVCVVNFFNDNYDNTYLVEKAEYANKFFKTQLELEFICGISQTTNSIEKLPELFDQVTEIMAFKFLDQKESILVYDDIVHNTGSYEYTVDTQHQLIHLLTLGEYRQSVALVEHIFNTNLKNEKMNISMLRILISEMISTVLRAVAEIDKASVLDTKELCSLTTQMNNVNQLQNTKERLCGFLEELCILNGNQNKNVEDGRSKNIKEYIHTHYNDPNLNVSMIAEVFGITLNYISSYFKEQVGEGMAEYIVRYRIDKAKQLLCSFDKTVNEIGLDVGFYNTNVFIRAFKKLEGMTPGQYRKYFTK